MSEDEKAQRWVEQQRKLAQEYRAALSLLGDEGRHRIQPYLPEREMVTKEIDWDTAQVIVTAAVGMLQYATYRRIQKTVVRHKNGEEKPIPQQISPDFVEEIKKRTLELEDPILLPPFSQKEWDEIARDFWKDLRKSD